MAYIVDPDTCPADLVAAKAALRKLLLGQQVRVFVDQNGERVEYSAANLQALKDWVSALDSVCGATATGNAPLPQRPLGFTF